MIVRSLPWRVTRFSLLLVAACKQPPISGVAATARDQGAVLDAARSGDLAPRTAPVVKPQCAGADLDLDVAFRDFACLGQATGVPPGLELAITSPTPSVAPGVSAEITLTWTNTNDVAVGWGIMTMPGYDLFPVNTKDARGENVPAAYPCNPGRQGNVGAPMTIVIAAHGRGHVKRSWRASRSIDKCGDGTPLEPGTYTIGFGADPSVRVKPLTVTVRAP